MANWSATEISTVGSGRTYTTLAAWWAAKGGSGTTAPHAECYTGADLGTVTISGAVGTPTSDYYVRIYTATGERHDGTRSGTTGTYLNTGNQHGIDVQENYTRIEGLRLYRSNGQQKGAIALTNSVTNILVDGCVVVGIGNQATTYQWAYSIANNVTATVQNCLAYGTTGAKTGINSSAFRCWYCGAVSILNCAVTGWTDASGVYDAGFFAANTTTPVVWTNCVSIGNSTGNDFER
ncbi:hypothetical protein LCGC14_2719410, partial [marine sediment metagenome]